MVLPGEEILRRETGPPLAKLTSTVQSFWSHLRSMGGDWMWKYVVDEKIDVMWKYQDYRMCLRGTSSRPSMWPHLSAFESCATSDAGLSSQIRHAMSNIMAKLSCKTENKNI